jgi:hypothetical protein
MKALTDEQKVNIMRGLRVGTQVNIEIADTKGNLSQETAKFEICTAGGRFRVRRKGGVMCWLDAAKFVGLADAAPVVPAPAPVAAAPSADVSEPLMQALVAVPVDELPACIAERGGSLSIAPDGSAFELKVDVPLKKAKAAKAPKVADTFEPAKKGDVVSLDLPQHNWDKLNLVTKRAKGRSFDVWGCRACGLAGNRYGVSDNIEVTKAAGKNECRPVAPELVGMPALFPVQDSQPAGDAEQPVEAAKPVAAKKPRKKAPVADAATVSLRPKGGRPAPGAKSLRQLVLEELQAVANSEGKLEQTGPQFAAQITAKLNASTQSINNALFKLTASGFIVASENTRKGGPLALSEKGRAGYSINPVGGAGTLKARIKELIEKGGTDREVASEVGADVAYVHDVRTGRVTGRPRKVAVMVEEAVTE